MKKTIVIISLIAFIAACGDSSSDYASNSESADSTSAANQNAVTHQPTIDTNVNKIGTSAAGTESTEKGSKLIAPSDCLNCHKIGERFVGPSYKEVAGKYEATPANIDMLAGKIIKGGKGNWGEVPMIAHPNLRPDDAKEMVRYILSLK